MGMPEVRMKPEGFVQFDPDHSLNRGLVFALEATEAGSVPQNRSPFVFQAPAAFQTAAPAWSGGDLGPGLNFNGTSQGLVFADHPAQRLQGGAVSIFARIRRSAGGAQYQQIIRRGTAWYLFTDGSILKLAINDGYAQGGYTLPAIPNAWESIGGVFDPRLATITIYHNGLPVVTRAEAGLIPASDGRSLDIGCYTSASQFFKGQIDGLRVYNRVVTADEAATLARHPYEGLAERLTQRGMSLRRFLPSGRCVPVGGSFFSTVI